MKQLSSSSGGGGAPDRLDYNTRLAIPVRQAGCPLLLLLQLFFQTKTREGLQNCNAASHAQICFLDGCGPEVVRAYIQAYQSLTATFYSFY